MSIINSDNLKSILSNLKTNVNNEICSFETTNFNATISEKYTKMKDIPYQFMDSQAVAVGSDIYLFGSADCPEYAYRYDTNTNTYTKLKNIPYGEFRCGCTIYVNGNIYLLGSGSYNFTNKSYPYTKYHYRYNIASGTYKRMNDIPYDFFYGSAVAIGTDIYLLGSIYYDTTNKIRPYAKYNYKYDITTDTYTKATDIPYDFYLGSAVAIGTDIYLLGSSNNSYYKYNYKYDTTTNTYTQNSDIPYNFNCGSAVAIGTDIYLLGGNYSSDYNKYNYKYDTTTDTYTKNADIPYIFYLGSAVNVDNNIYIFGGYSSNTDPILAKYNYKYDIPYTGNCVIKLTNHSIYTSNNRSFVNHKASIIPLEDGIYYTEYKGNNIIKNTFSIDSNGNTKMYIKSGAILNGKKVNVDTKGWNTINLLDYM